MEPLSDRLEWPTDECRDASEWIKAGAPRVLGMLNICPAVNDLSFDLHHDDIGSQKDCNEPEDFEGNKSSLPRSGLLSMHCIPTLRRLSISCSGGDFLDVKPCGDLIAAAACLGSLHVYGLEENFLLCRCQSASLRMQTQLEIRAALCKD